MSETQKTVAKWANETFDFPPLSATVEKLKHEVAELNSALPHEIGRELADIQILLWQIAEWWETDIQKEVDMKMEINRSRKWKRMPDGTYQHEEGKRNG